MSKLTDRELLERASCGDEAAVEGLLDRYKPLVLSRAAQYFLRGGEHDDLIQEAMIGLFSAITSCPEERREGFSAYAFNAVDNRLKDAIRRDAAKKNRLLSDSVSLEEELGNDLRQGNTLGDTIETGDTLTPEEEVLREESLEELYSFLSTRLTAREQEVLLLFAAGESYKEISAKLGVSHKSVDGALRRARSKLKSYRDEEQRHGPTQDQTTTHPEALV